MCHVLCMFYVLCIMYFVLCIMYYVCIMYKYISGHPLSPWVLPCRPTPWIRSGLVFRLEIVTVVMGPQNNCHTVIWVPGWPALSTNPCKPLVTVSVWLWLCDWLTDWLTDWLRLTELTWDQMTRKGSLFFVLILVSDRPGVRPYHTLESENIFFVQSNLGKHVIIKAVRDSGHDLGPGSIDLLFSGVVHRLNHFGGSAPLSTDVLIVAGKASGHWHYLNFYHLLSLDTVDLHLLLWLSQERYAGLCLRHPLVRIRLLGEELDKPPKAHVLKVVGESTLARRLSHLGGNQLPGFPRGPLLGTSSGLVRHIVFEVLEYLLIFMWLFSLQLS